MSFSYCVGHTVAGCLIALAVSGLAFVQGKADGSGGGGPGADDHSGEAPQILAHRFTIPHAQSWFWGSLQTQTVVKVINDSISEIDVQIQWFQGWGPAAGSTIATIPARESRLLTTANPGEVVPPYSVFSPTAVYRDSTEPFYGHALVMVGPAGRSARNVQVTATFLHLIGKGYDGSGTGNAGSITTLQVMRADDADRDGVVDTRFKGD